MSLDEHSFREIIKSPNEIGRHLSSDDIESALRDGIRLQWLLSRPEDRNAEQLYVSIERICRKLVPEVSKEFQNLAEGEN